MGRLFYVIHGIHDNLSDGNKLITVPSLYQIKNPFLCVLQNIFQALFAHITGIGNFLVNADQSPQSCFFRHDIGIMLDVGRRRNRRDQIADEFQTAHLRRHILFLSTGPAM